MSKFARLRREIQAEHRSLTKRAAAIREDRRRLYQLGKQLKENEQELRATAARLRLAFRSLQPVKSSGYQDWSRLIGKDPAKAGRVRGQAKRLLQDVAKRFPEATTAQRQGVLGRIKDRVIRFVSQKPASATGDIRFRLSPQAARDLEKVLQTSATLDNTGQQAGPQQSKAGRRR